MKLIKILATVLSINLITAVLPTAMASEALQLSDPIYTLKTDDTEKIVAKPEPGFVTTTLTATNVSDKSTSACLVVSATDKTTGKLVAVDIDAQAVPAKDSVQLSKGIDLGANQTYNYYVWDNVLNHTPQRNTPPTDIKSIECEAKTNSVVLSWDDSLDDVGIKSYILKLNGNEVARAKEANYELLGLERGSSYTCEVTACDDEGLMSKSISVDASTYDVESLVLTEDDDKGNIQFYDNHTGNTMDSYTVADTIAGRDCYKNTQETRADGSKRTGFFYFPVSSRYIDASVNSVAFEITYYDDDLNALSIQYNAADGSSGKNVNLPDRTNTNTWKTVYTTVDDAKFTNNKDLTNSSFRVSGPAGTRIYKVALCPGDQFSPKAPNVEFGEGVTDTYDMSFYPDSEMAAYNMEYTTIDGTPCMESQNGNGFEFDVRDTRAQRTGGYVEVNYYDNGEDSLVLKYNDINGAKKEAVEFTNTQAFKTVQIPLEAAVLKNGITGADKKKFDFTLSTKGGSPLAIASVKYVPGDSDYVPEPVTEVSAVVSEDGTELEGTLELDSPQVPDTTSYDKNILFSGTMGKPMVDGKHYMYNQEYTAFESGKSWKRWKNAFYFKIPDEFIYGNNYTHLVFEVEYYAPSGNIEILTKNSSNSDTSLAKTAVSPNKWTTQFFDAYVGDGKNIVFSNSLNGCDFRINFDCQAYVHKVVVYRDDE